jgi:hypothetical protein
MERNVMSIMKWLREREKIKGKKLIGMQRHNFNKIHMKNKRIGKGKKGSEEIDRLLNQQ